MTNLELFLESKNKLDSRNLNLYAKIINKLYSQFGTNLTNLDIKELNAYIQNDFKKYSFHGTEKTYAPKTYEKNVSIIRTFFKFLYEERLIKINYSAYIKTIEQKRHVDFDKLPTAEHLLAIYKKKFSDPMLMQDYYLLRDLVIFNLILHSGLSPKELVSITRQDLGIYKDNHAIKIREPIERFVHINKDDVALISKLVELLSTEQTKDDSLFITERLKGCMSTRYINYIISEMYKDVFVNDKPIPPFSTRDLKKTGIIAALSAGYPKELMKEQLSLKSKNYFEKRFKYAEHPKVLESYADLFSNS